jgi:RimJ/RimL family protein N-acetyltransferase
MRYADELPFLRDWTKSDDRHFAWAKYQERRSALGKAYTQLILHLAEGAPIGESFFAPLPERYAFGKWRKPEGVVGLMGDIKLMPDYWGQGFGSEVMQLIAAWLFRNTDASLLMVPPHRKNPAAERVYEKAGFQLYRGMRSYHNHKVMELSQRRFIAGTPPE